MPYVIYDSKMEGRIRQRGVSYAARRANWIPADQSYGYLTNHPIEDKAALEIAVEGGFYDGGLLVPQLNFAVFFTQLEIDEAVEELPAEWFIIPETV